MSRVFGQIFHLIIGKRQSTVRELKKVYLDAAVSSHFHQDQQFK
jgi:hypothetical protein